MNAVNVSSNKALKEEIENLLEQVVQDAQIVSVEIGNKYPYRRIIMTFEANSERGQYLDEQKLESIIDDHPQLKLEREWTEIRKGKLQLTWLCRA